MGLYSLKNLRTSFMGRCCYRYNQLPTTMEVARGLAEDKAPEGTVVIADVQSAGRGRLGRSWLSPYGSLAMSVILRPPLDYLPGVIMVSSLAVLRTIEQTTGLKCTIKWPNDVLIGGRKVCGILVESETAGKQLNYVVLGVGVNINFDTSVFPEISDIATSLSRELGKDVDREEFAGVLLFELEKLYLELLAGGYRTVYKQWREHLETLGRTVVIRSGQRVEKGMAEDVTEDGRLLLRRADGSLIEITTGDVTVVKE